MHNAGRNQRPEEDHICDPILLLVSASRICSRFDNMTLKAS